MRTGWRDKVTITLGLAVGILLVILIQVQFGATKEIEPSYRLSAAATPASLHPHPLPLTLAQWQDANNSGDYFVQVNPTEVGYLVWSHFPIKVYVERSEQGDGTDQERQWVNSVVQAVQEWNVYLPLVVVRQAEFADITILNSRPPLRTSTPGNIPRARSAETRYQLYVSQASTYTNILSHRCTILLGPSQTSQYLIASARHELGHALGIWGHSPVTTDALYFSQVRNPPPISPRDLNTLKRVYEQPTRLGWPLSTLPQPVEIKLGYKVVLAE